MGIVCNLKPFIAAFATHCLSSKNFSNVTVHSFNDSLGRALILKLSVRSP
jgi:hypothetical protein